MWVHLPLIKLVLNESLRKKPTLRIEDYDNIKSEPKINHLPCLMYFKSRITNKLLILAFKNLCPYSDFCKTHNFISINVIFSDAFIALLNSIAFMIYLNLMMMKLLNRHAIVKKKLHTLCRIH